MVWDLGGNKVGIQLHEQKNVITMDRFINKKHLKKDSLIALIFFLIFLVVGGLEDNWFLEGDSLGFFEHKNIWIFLLINLFIPVIVNLSFKTLECNIDNISIKRLKNNFESNAKAKGTTILWQFFRAVGFCCFVGNSLQNAHLINQLPFDYWDSINYLISYIASRFYKLYLFAFFIPMVLIYGFILLKSIQEIIARNGRAKNKFAENYEQVNALCSFGLDILLILVIPFTLLTIVVYSIHDRFDITTITTIIASGVCTLMALGAYAFLIKSFYRSVSQYKRKNVREINSQLGEIHKYVLNYRIDKDDSEILDVYLKKEEYLYHIKEKIEGLSRFPQIIKAILATVSPMIPSVLELLFTLKYTS